MFKKQRSSEFLFQAPKPTILYQDEFDGTIVTERSGERVVNSRSAEEGEEDGIHVVADANSDTNSETITTPWYKKRDAYFVLFAALALVGAIAFVAVVYKPSASTQISKGMEFNATDTFVPTYFPTYTPTKPGSGFLTQPPVPAPTPDETPGGGSGPTPPVPAPTPDETPDGGSGEVDTPKPDETPGGGSGEVTPPTPDEIPDGGTGEFIPSPTPPYVTFQPTPSGTNDATVTVNTEATGQPSPGPRGMEPL